MSSSPKFSVDTMEALAVSMAVFQKHNHRVDRYKNGINGNKEDIINHFEKGSDLILDLQSTNTVKTTIAHFVTMSVIAGKPVPDFIKTVHDLLETSAVSTKQAGVLAWAPKLAYDIARTEDDRSELLRIGKNSKWLLSKGSKLVLDFHLLKTRYIHSYNSYHYTGHDGHGNIIIFYHKKAITGSVKISAKVKAHRQDPNVWDAHTTVLNYVKVIK